MAEKTEIRYDTGFGLIHRNIMRDKELSIESKAIYSYISSFAGVGMVAYPGISLMCNELNISEKRFHKYKKELLDKGYLSIERESKGKGFSKNVYTLHVKPITGQIVPLQNVGLQNVSLQNNHTNNNSINNNSINNNSNNILSSNARPYEQIINYLNDKAGKNFKHTTEANKRLINGRYNDGYTLEDFMKVIDNKVSQWKGTDSEMYLRPKTLFSPSNFESYLNEVSKGSSNFNINSFLGDIKE